MNLTTDVKHIDSPYADIQTQIKRDAEYAKELSDNVDLNKYNLSLMIPKVSYDDWVVCHYLEDGNLYLIDEENITEVKPIGLLEYNDDFQAIGSNGEIVSEDELYDYYPCLCCGEADDMTCYVYFEEVE
jgi:hypothetical protein